jgi:hypothetical protein
MMRWMEKKWSRYTMGALLVFFLGIVPLLEKLGTGLVVLSFLAFLVGWLWIYYRHPEKFKD